MRRILGAGSLLLSVTILGACDMTSRGLTDRDVTAVRESMDAYVRTALAADWGAWGKLMLPDVVAMPPNHAPVVGREAAVAYGKAFPKLTKFNLTVDEITGRGDVAYARGRYSLSMLGPDGKTANEKGSFLEIHVRQSDGTWPYARFIWHSDTPPPDAPK